MAKAPMVDGVREAAAGEALRVAYRFLGRWQDGFTRNGREARQGHVQSLSTRAQKDRWRTTLAPRSRSDSTASTSTPHRPRITRPRQPPTPAPGPKLTHG